MTESDLRRAADFIRTSVVTEDHPGPFSGAHLIEKLQQRAQRRARARLVLGGAIVGLVAVGSWVAPRLSATSELTYRVEGSSAVAMLGNYINAPPGKPVELRFSEGSHVVFEPKARGRIAQMTRHGATMILEEGRARATIIHREKTDWRVYAGPYVVSVKGTSFEVSYAVASQTFELEMHEGAVRVSGPGLVSPIEVRNSQRFVFSANNPETASPSEASKVPAAGLAQSEGAVPTMNANAASAPEPQAVASVQRDRPAAINAPTPPASWSQLAAQGDHHRIMALAEERGLDDAIASANRPDLLALADAARFAGKLGVATKAYRAVRGRFAGTNEASNAAFFLGRVSETADPARAIGWYDRYVAEAPTGTWVAEALGRRMVLLKNSQGAAAAEPAAKDYFSRFPDGPYAGFARKILGL
jgi:ferric-dicitrate binding protein FerR (iron transport regulator)